MIETIRGMLPDSFRMKLIKMGVLDEYLLDRADYIRCYSTEGLGLEGIMNKKLLEYYGWLNDYDTKQADAFYLDRTLWWSVCNFKYWDRIHANIKIDKINKYQT